MTVKLPAVAELQLSVAVPEPVMLVGLKAPQVRADGTVSPSVTVPAKPFTAVTVIVDVADEPAVVGAGELAVIVKSVTVSMKLPVEPVWTVSPLYVAEIWCVPALPAPGV